MRQFGCRYPRSGCSTSCRATGLPNMVIDLSITSRPVIDKSLNISSLLLMAWTTELSRIPSKHNGYAAANISFRIVDNLSNIRTSFIATRSCKLDQICMMHLFLGSRLAASVCVPLRKLANHITNTYRASPLLP